jgi:hypothetical protein
MRKIGNAVLRRAERSDGLRHITRLPFASNTFLTWRDRLLQYQCSTMISLLVIGGIRSQMGRAQDYAK